VKLVDESSNSYKGEPTSGSHRFSLFMLTDSESVNGSAEVRE